MKETNTLIVGASIFGLASAACLKTVGIEYTIIEKYGQVAMPWRNHYERLHLHINKNLSTLPHKKFPSDTPGYPSRMDVTKYMDEYRQQFEIHPLFHTDARSISRTGAYWITETNQDTFRSRNLIMAIVSFGIPRTLQISGQESFPGMIVHSSLYKTGKDFRNQGVLVIDSPTGQIREIALDARKITRDISKR